MGTETRGDAALGVAAMAVAVTIWAGWIVAVRASVTTALTPADIAVLRYGTPALVLAPVLWRSGPIPKGVAPWRVAVMTLGWGAPFALFAAQGMTTASAATTAALVPGALPLWVALISAAVAGARYDGAAKVGLALIAAAALAVVGPEALAADWAALAGAPWLCAASISWACYAVAYRGAGLTPVQATAVVAFWSSVLLVPSAFLLDFGLHRLPAGEFAVQLALHGLLSGVVSVATFALGVSRLGAPRAAAFSALVPVLAAVGGVVVLGEALAPRIALAILAASAGVALVNGVRPWKWIRRG